MKNVTAVISLTIQDDEAPGSTVFNVTSSDGVLNALLGADRAHQCLWLTRAAASAVATIMHMAEKNGAGNAKKILDQYTLEIQNMYECTAFTEVQKQDSNFKYN